MTIQLKAQLKASKASKAKFITLIVTCPNCGGVKRQTYPWPQGLGPVPSISLTQTRALCAKCEAKAKLPLFELALMPLQYPSHYTQEYISYLFTPDQWPDPDFLELRKLVTIWVSHTTSSVPIKQWQYVTMVGTDPHHLYYIRHVPNTKIELALTPMVFLEGGYEDIIRQNWLPLV